ncbi:MAG TPA: hypothetical protein VLA46_01975 [Saprospiraceae bacterium]|nr:hypothetical protein [Saprospiraceae bacterium]
MKRTFLFIGIVLIVLGCQTPSTEKTEATAAPAETPKSTVVMPYTATYSSNFTTDVSDEHLKNVLDSYVYWENGDMKALSSVMGDSIFFENHAGVQKTYSNADLMTMWQKSRDSLSNVKIRMVAWQKLKSDKGHKFILTWYDEIDTYKTGKVDSVVMHDINTIDSVGKIVRYSQYRKPKLN